MTKLHSAKVQFLIPVIAATFFAFALCQTARAQQEPQPTSGTVQAKSEIAKKKYEELPLDDKISTTPAFQLPKGPVPNPGIHHRQDWGAKAVQEELMRPHKNVQLTIHHEGVLDDGKVDDVRKLAGLQRFSINDKPWGDNPYHFTITREGEVWEGRVSDFAGDTNTTYDPTGHLLVEVAGSFNRQPFTPVLHTSLVHLLAYLSQQYDISPDTIKGHKDFAQTDCPGEGIHALIRDGSLVKEVKDYMKECAEKKKSESQK